METSGIAPNTRRVHVPQTLETTAWKWMRYSALLLLPLAWIHVIIQDVLVGVHRIDLDYVALRWANVGWRVYDIALLAFAFAHGMNGLRQILGEYFNSDRARQIMGWVLFGIWFIITAIGAFAVIGGVRPAQP
jgi:succinate dehydrogenase / fumarate reductase, membrane anchor subunit